MSHILLNRLNLLYMALVMCIATPLNVCVLIKLVRKLQRQGVNRRNVLLKLHLNISDLSMCVLSLLPRIIWAITHEFYGGWFSCKLVMYLVLFCFLLSSSILAVIGLDRLWTILRPFVAAKQALVRVKWLIACAWVYSLANALPQLVVWDTVEVPLNGGRELHCVSVFMFSDVEREHMEGNGTASLLMHYMHHQNMQLLSKVYAYQHLISAFCLPFAITFICYSVMMQQVCRYLVCHNEPPQDQRRTSVDSAVSATTKNTHISKEATTAATMRSNQHSLRNRPGTSKAQNPAVHQLQRKATTSSLMNSVGVSRSTLQRMGTQTSLAINNIRYRRRGNGQTSIRTSLSMLKTAFVLITSYLCCWVTYTIYNAVVTLSEEQPDNHEWYNTWSKNMLLFNSVINPLLYGFTRKDLRQLARRVRRTGQSIGRCVCCVCCICCKLFTYEWDESSDY